MKRLILFSAMLSLAVLTSCTQPSRNDSNSGVVTYQDYKEQQYKSQFESAYDRDEFERLVIGKTQNEVIQLLGRPFSTNEGRWIFQHKTKDPISLQVDDAVSVVFSGDICTRVHYIP